MNRANIHISILPLCLVLACAALNAADSPPTRLLNGKNLDAFTVFMKDSGNTDPDKVFTMRDGMLYISGQRNGYLATKHEFANYRLVAEFKWAGKNWPPRDQKTRNSGIFIHAQPGDRIMPQSVEIQLQEGATGDVIPISGASLTQDGETKAKGRFDRPGREPFKDVLGFRGPNEIEKPHGEWNTVEIVADGDRLKVSVNGKITFDGTRTEPAKGRILIECAYAEMWWRKFDVHPLTKK
ncbi:MAG: hypothetical protein FD161_100 [Limisphaerales bacterium]|nr:MAG: hypothetical protein FD161_100 [Limisphaerales bacterium]KAG0510546.1 MAG: hypothetical protein E1N63_100 [Limisphaerales bacterium]TXT52819.1 MAG: hypothetical protein FD140_362 [Limisphaerales bacterium]